MSEQFQEQPEIVFRSAVYIDALRDFGSMVYTIKAEGSDRLWSSLNEVYYHSKQLLDIPGANTELTNRIIGEQMPSPLDNRPFHEDFSSLQLTPLEIISDDSVDKTALSYDIISIAFDIALKPSLYEHLDCINPDNKKCCVDTVCPKQWSKQLGFKILENLAMRQAVGIGDDEKLRGTYKALREKMGYHELATRTEVMDYYQNIFERAATFVDDVEYFLGTPRSE